ncbi:F-actin-monooxygenase mical2b isoform X5 [Triplophysa dalaica]|uniref:F-actin-monooxygenase mical2b isoform X5 n=1 Tax=Triplophysa dalaica TaxID=1582913 RepID=UPI0024DFEEA9|nr:F-actin-monooxygenase mical2b isoform X5 [Triplophysa dalaica]
MGDTEDEKNQAGRLFENFVQASDCKSTLQSFNVLCGYLELDPQEHSTFYSSLKSTLTCWKAKALWSKLDKRASHKEYKKGKACEGTKCLIIGGGPCGLRTAIELALLGAKVVVIEKRDTFSRNNVLHLWPFTIHDLRGLGAKKFYGKFCAGAIDHISIRQLQQMLLKIALVLGVEFHVNVEFVKLVEPTEDQENEGPGWRAEIRPADHPVADFDFDVVVGADGRRNSLEGFRRKEFRGKLAIAITANFNNRNTTAEAKVEEISGVAFIFNQKFFLDLRQETGIDLENIVYYKDKTHYFVMTAKKQSLLDKGVIIHDYIDTEALLNSENVDQEALLAYAREAADYATHYQLPTLDYATNPCGQPDVAMFDFTCMCASENAALVRERFGRNVLVALVGDSLLEPFWPMGTGCARGFLAAFDTAWMVKSWAQGRSPLDVLAERESLYRLLPQTTPENIAKNFDLYTIDPGTRYPNLNSTCVRPHQVRSNYICGEMKVCSLERAATIRRPVNLARRESEIRPSRLLTWCQKQTDGYRGVNVTDLTSCWTSGLALCALIHRFRPQLIDFDTLKHQDCAKNLQLAFDVSEREFGIKPFITGKDLVSSQDPDKTSMSAYLSKFYELFRGTPLPPTDSKHEEDANNVKCSSSSPRPVYKSLQPRKRIPKNDEKVEVNSDAVFKRRRKFDCLEEVSATTKSSNQRSFLASEGLELKENRVKFMATQLLAKFDNNTGGCSLRRQTESNVESPPRPPSSNMTDSPLFNIIKNKVPPPPKDQFPSVSRVSQEQSAPLFPSLHSSPLNPRRKPTHTHSHAQSEAETTASSGSGYADTRRSTVLAMKEMLQRLQKVEDKISQRKAQTENAREFHAKNIKEKGVHLSALFSSETASQHQRTVEKVSLVVGARADSPVDLYANDHRPKKSDSDTPPSFRRELPQSLGDVCHVCRKRVFAVERLSAEGFHFHRECFRCDTCRAPLCQGRHSFDSQEEKLYCKLHFGQRKSLVKNGGTQNLHTTIDDRVHDNSSWSPVGDENHLMSEPPGTLSSLLKKGVRWPLHVSQTVCSAPRRVFNWLHGKMCAAGEHMRDNAEDYVFLYELLTVSLPLLGVLHELVLQTYGEAEPLNLQPIQHWLEQHLVLFDLATVSSDSDSC